MDTNLISQCRHKKYSKAFVDKLQETLPSTVSQNQTAYAKNRCISKSRRMIADIINVCEKETYLWLHGNHGY